MKIALLLSMSFCAWSCNQLPSLRYSVSRYGLDATLVDATNGKPLRRTDVSVVIDSTRFELRTSRNGTLRVSPLKNRYWIWFGGSPETDFPIADILIEAEGFESKRIEWSMFDRSHLPIEDGRIQAGSVEMKNR
jgi:hypothetical protein